MTPSRTAGAARALARAGTTPADAALALGLTLIVASELTSDLYSAPLLAAPLVISAGLSLAWRRRYPLAVATVVCTVSFVISATAPKEFPPQLYGLAVIVAIYSLATSTRGQRAAVAAGLTLPILVAAHVVTREGRPDDFFPYLVWGASWIAGSIVRRRTDEAAIVATEATLHARRAEAEAAEAAALERDRIARELHDVVAHAVSLIVVQAGAERLTLGSSAPRTTAVLDAIETAGRQALVELRSMLAVLRSPAGTEKDLQPQPGLGALSALVDSVRDAGLPVSLDMGAPGDVAPGVALSAYRIVQEALTNALKHGAPAAAVSLRCDGLVLDVTVTSSLAVGTHAPIVAGVGRGLPGMRERAALHGGTLDAGPEHGEWIVHARLPVTPATVGAR